MTEKPVKLVKDSVLSNLEQVSPLDKQSHGQPPKEGDVKDIIEGMISNVDASITGQVKDKLRQVLYKHSAVFSKDEWDLGWTDLVTHEIDTADARPIRQPLRRYPPSHQEAIDQQVSDMLRQRVIEPASSPWASNVVRAKKDGTLRCCIGYRQLNEVTRKDAYPLPRTDACLDAMAGSGIFSTFDLRSGFHQVAMEQRDADKTAFRTRRGIFRFGTMPFGLCNATASFQPLMDLVLCGLNLEICLAYLHDVILFSRTPEEHLERLDLVLQRLEDANLKLKPSKCCLMQTRVTFLGHIVSGEGLATDPEKIHLLKDWPTPTTLRHVRGFLGLTGYYRKFIKDYAKIATPLTSLMKKDHRFVWTADCQAAFDTLKEALLSPPVLTLPNDVDTFILDTDAA